MSEHKLRLTWSSPPTTELCSNTWESAGLEGDILEGQKWEGDGSDGNQRAGKEGRVHENKVLQE